jgi:hypothetical protein
MNSMLAMGRELGLGILLSVVVAGCADPGPMEDSAGFDMKLSALTATCGSQDNKNPLADIATFKVVARDRDPGYTGKETPFTTTVAMSAGMKSILVKNIPAGTREVTLLGFPKGGTEPTWYARHRAIKIAKTKESTIDLALHALEGFSCFSGSSMPNVLFPAAVPVANGKILITGGFAHVQDATDGKNWELATPKDTAFLFDPATGTLETLANRMKVPRGGHAMVYVVQLNKVLIVGGAQRLTARKDGSEPPMWSPNDGVNEPFELYDIDKKTFELGKGKEFVKKRVLPNLITLTDGSVVVVGGAPWPETNDPTYAKGDLFKASSVGFENTFGALDLNRTRAGAAVAYMGQTNLGTRRYLIWGGNRYNKDDKSTQQVAERFTESTDSGQGVFVQEYVLEGDFPGDASLYFPTLTALPVTLDKNGKPNEDGRFLSVGGARWDGSKWAAPSKDDVYLITVKEQVDTAKGRIVTKRISGLSEGVYLHQTVAAGSDHVIISGGFGAFDKKASFTLRAFDATQGKLLDAGATPAQKSFVVRGGHAAVALSNDCILGFGGTDEWGEMQANKQAVADIYCPKLLTPK